MSEDEARRNGTKPTLRDSAGRFVPGTAPGPGRPAGYARSFAEVVTPEALAEVLTVVLDAARKGDLRAADLILRRALPAAVEVPIGEEPLHIEVAENATPEEVARAVAEALTREPTKAEQN